MTADEAKPLEQSQGPSASGAPRAELSSAPRITTRPRRLTSLARWAFYTHLWLGVLVTGMVLVLSVTGVLLNHKQPLGLIPDPTHTPSGELATALSLEELVKRAVAAQAANANQQTAPVVDRMDVRPDKGLVKVRFDDPAITEVTLDLQSGAVLAVGPRNDVFLERLHSGEIFGDSFVLLSDGAAIILILLAVSGFWLWLYPKSRVKRNYRPDLSTTRKGQ